MDVWDFRLARLAAAAATIGQMCILRIVHTNIQQHN